MGELTPIQMEAILGSESSEAFQNFISDLIDNNNDSDPDSLVLKLVEIIDPSLGHNYRQECSQLLCKLVADSDDDNSLWNFNRLTDSTQVTIKCNLLNLILLEKKPECIIRDTVSAFAGSLLPANNWSELLPFMYHCLSSCSNNCYLKGSIFMIFSKLADGIGETIVPYCVKDLRPIFLNTLNDNNDDDDDDLAVRISVTEAVISFIMCLEDRSNEKERFQDLLPGMMNTLTDALSNGYAAANYVLNLFIVLAKNDPKFLRPQLAIVVGSIFEIAENESLEAETRHLAVLFMLALVEARDKVPGMMKKLPLFTTTCFGILVDLLLDIEDEPSWHSAEIEHEDAGVTDNYTFGQDCLDRFSKALGGKTITPIAIERMDEYLAAPEWEKRHASLIALAQIAEGSSKVMIKNLERLVDMVLASFQDDHPRVRWAAINAIGMLSTDLSPHLQEQCHSQIMPALSAAMDDFQNPRVQAHAAAALLNFCNSDMPETLVPYIDGILIKLLALLQNDKEMVQKGALNGLANVAYLSEEHFQKYYDFVMPTLNTILVSANDKSKNLLRNRALECISLVGMAVGKEKFRDDLKQVMEVLKSSQESQLEEFDTISYNLKTWCRICKCMGKEFIPYMSTAMYPLIECAQLELDNTVLSEDPGDSIHKVKFGDEIICIKGSDLLEGKAVACGLLGIYAQSLEEDFYPWIPQAASILVPLLKFYIRNDVRGSAIDGMYPLLHSAKLVVEKGTAQCGNESYFKQLPGYIILAMGDALYSEPEAKLCATLLSGLDDCFKICGPILNEDQIHIIMDEINHVITESSRRKGELIERAKLEDFDAEEAELLREERELGETVFSNVGDVLMTLIKQFKVAFLPFLDELSSYLMPMRGEDKTAKERAQCVCIFDDLVDNYGEATLKYYNVYLPFLLESSNDENPDVRQAALYGVGLWAQYGGYSFKPFIGEALSRINVVITHFNALEHENLWAYDNAVSALGKIYHFHQDSIDSVLIIPAWLNCLPIKEDLAEAKVVHDLLCSMVERSEGELWNHNYLHLPKVILVFTEVICAGEVLATEETTKRMINLLRHFQKTLPPATWASTWSLLLPQQEMELESIL